MHLTLLPGKILGMAPVQPLSRLAIAGLFSGLLSNTVWADDLFGLDFSIQNTEVFTRIDSLSHSQIASIDQTMNNLEGPALKRGETSFTTNSMDVGQKTYFRFKGFRAGLSYSLFTRKDYYLKYTPDTAELIYADQNNIELSGDKVFDVDLATNSIEADGVSVGFIGFFQDKLEYEIKFSFMDAYKMSYGRLSGDINSLDENANGSLLLDYQYSEDVIFDREANDVTAKGKSIDIDVLWHVTQRFNFRLKTKDLYSEILWRDQDRTVADANTDRVEVDEFGNVSARPLMRRKEDTYDLIQRLPAQIWLSESFALTSRGTIKVEHYWYDSFLFNRLGYQYQFGSATFVETFYDMGAEAWGLGFSTPLLELMVVADSTDIEQAQTLGLMSRVNFSF